MLWSHIGTYISNCQCNTHEKSHVGANRWISRARANAAYQNSVSQTNKVEVLSLRSHISSKSITENSAGRSQTEEMKFRKNTDITSPDIRANSSSMKSDLLLDVFSVLHARHTNELRHARHTNEQIAYAQNFGAFTRLYSSRGAIIRICSPSTNFKRTLRTLRFLKATNSYLQSSQGQKLSLRMDSDLNY